MQNVLTYHVVGGNVSSTDLSDGLEVTMLNDEIVTIAIDGETVTVEDVPGGVATVIAPDIFVSNGK